MLLLPILSCIGTGKMFTKSGDINQSPVYYIHFLSPVCA